MLVGLGCHDPPTPILGWGRGVAGGSVGVVDVAGRETLIMHRKYMYESGDFSSEIE